MSITGYNIKLIRLHVGLSQEELALKVSSTRDAIAAYESGRTKKILSTIVNKVGALVGLNFDQMNERMLDISQYPPKSMIESAVNEPVQPYGNQSLSTCLQALSFANKTIETMEGWLKEKDNVIELLKKHR